MAATLVLAACQGGGAGAGGPSSAASQTAETVASSAPADHASGTPPPDPTPAVSSGPADRDDEGTGDGADGGAAIPAFTGTCTLTPATGAADTVRLAEPAAWTVGDDCTFFDPEAESLPDATDASAAVTWKAEPVDFATAADVRDQLRDPIRYVGARSGYQALRVEGESTGSGLRPAGEPVTLWLVDLDPGTDDQGGGTLVGTAVETDGAPFDVATGVLDRMGDSIGVVPNVQATPEELVVTRLEGGGTPRTVTWKDGCFDLHSGGPRTQVIDVQCDMTRGDGLQVALVGDRGNDTGELWLVGVAGPGVSRATLPAANSLSGAIATPIEGGALFAMPARRPPFEVTTYDADGDVLQTRQVTG